MVKRTVLPTEQEKRDAKRWSQETGEPDVSESLTLSNLFDPKKIGPNLLEAAREQRRKVFTQQVVNQVEQLVLDAEKNRSLSVQYARREKIARAKVEAIENGQFTIENDQIVYTDDKLRGIAENKINALQHEWDAIWR